MELRGINFLDSNGREETQRTCSPVIFGISSVETWESFVVVYLA
jgi:hypothetical protein